VGVNLTSVIHAPRQAGNRGELMSDKSNQRDPLVIQDRIQELIEKETENPSAWIYDIADFIEWLTKDIFWREEFERRVNAIFDVISSEQIYEELNVPSKKARFFIKRARAYTEDFYEYLYKRHKNYSGDSPETEIMPSSIRSLHRIGLYNRLKQVEDEIKGGAFSLFNWLLC